MEPDNQKFSGFDIPLENWCKLPLSLIDALPLISSKAELMVVLYILRHTWGFHEFDEYKTITVDEFINGRKRKNGDRIDSGTGLAAPSVRSGLKDAETHGFIEVVIDDHDKARIKKSYKLNLTNHQGVKTLLSDGKDFTPNGKESLPRSEKDTLVNKPKKNHIAPNGAKVPAAQMNPMKDAIAAAFKWDWATMTGPEKGLIQKTAKTLILAEICPEHIPSLYRYCASKFTDFGPGALANHVSAWKAAQPKPRPVMPDVPEPDEDDGVPDVFQAERASL